MRIVAVADTHRYETDLDVSLVATSTNTAPGASAPLEPRYTNRTRGPLLLRLDRRLHVSLRTTGPGGVTIDPPPGAPQLLPNPECTPTTCPTMSAGVVVLAPKGVLRIAVPWVAEAKAWPPPAKVACCTVAPGPVIGAGPLPPGRYNVAVRGPVELDSTSELSVARTVVDVVG